MQLVNFSSTIVLAENSLGIVLISGLRRGSVGDRDPRRWGKRESVPNATLSPPQ